MDFKDTSGAVREKVWRLYEESFPPHERRSLTAQEQKKRSRANWWYYNWGIVVVSGKGSCGVSRM